MPSTYTYQALVDYSQRLVKGIPIGDIDEIVCDQIGSIFWMAYPWRWTRGILTPIVLVDGTQDYSCANTDLWKPLTLRITYTTPTPDQYRDIRPTRWLEPFLQQKLSWPNFQLFCWDMNQTKIRLEAAAYVPSGQAYQIDGEYWKLPAKVTSLATTIPFPDHFANVFCEGLLWKLYRFADDARAGSAQLVRGQVVYTGQLGIFVDALITAKEAEESGIGDTIYPEESISGSVGLYGGPGLFM